MEEKSKPMPASVFVHRCRFVDHTPSAITAIAFPPPPLLKGKAKATGTIPGFGVLAVGRANGNIELHEWSGAESQTSAPQAWILQKVLPGPVSSKVESLVFTARFHDSYNADSPLQLSSLRLFSAGGGSEILEWNLDDGTILRSISSQAGTVWSMAANPASTLLALGCEDGSVRILSLADDTLMHHRRLDRVKSRLLSIAWGPAVLRHKARTVAQSQNDKSSEDEEETEEWVDVWLAVGCSDNSLRKFDFASGRVLDRMSTDKSRGEKTLVWAIGVLRDGTIVSGDSLGTVKFWDSTTCTQRESFQAHNADVLCITIGPEGRSVYTSGVDQKICQFSNVQVSMAKDGTRPTASHNRWIQAGSRRLHFHDVRALAVWPPYLHVATRHVSPSSTVAPLLVSGGLDMSPVICPCSLPSPNPSQNIINPIGFGHTLTFEDAYYHRVPYSTGMSHAVQIAREARLIMCRRDTGLTLWRISKMTSSGEASFTDLESSGSSHSDDWERVVDMELDVQTNLVASAISSGGLWVAASDLYETKLFHLVHTKDEIRPKRIKLSEGTASATAGVTSMLFTADSSKLILGASMGKALVVVLDITGNNKDPPRVLRIFEHHRMQNFIEGRGRILAKSTRNIPTLDDDTVMNDIEKEGSPDKEAMTSSQPYQSSPSMVSTVTRIAASLDGQWLASADTRRRIHVFNLDSIQHHCALPSLPYAINAITFDPAAPSLLVIGLANNTLQVFDVETRQFPSLYQGISSHISRLHDPLLGIAFDPVPPEGKDGQRALLWGSSWMCKGSLATPVGYSGLSKKRRRERRDHSFSPSTEDPEAGQAADEEAKFKLVTRYRPTLLVDFVGPGELVVIERPLVDLLSTLPPPYFKPTYGIT